MGSSDVEDSSDIRESLTTIKSQLKKLDLLEQVLIDVKDLKDSVEFNNSLIEVLKADNASLRIEVNNLKRLTDELVSEKDNMTKSILDLQCRSMRDNIIFHGITEMKNEAHHQPEELVKTFLMDNLEMNAEEVEAIRFSRVHRLGKPKVKQQRPRPIVAKVADSKMKSTVMSSKLKGSNYSISDQFPAEIMSRQRLLYLIMGEARESSSKARLSIDKLRQETFF